jgi:hypothetical protein
VALARCQIVRVIPEWFETLNAMERTALESESTVYTRGRTVLDNEDTNPLGRPTLPDFEDIIVGGGGERVGSPDLDASDPARPEGGRPHFDI